LAGEINTLMPHYVLERTVRVLNDASKPLKGSKICLLGVAYKKDVDDSRESPAFRLMELFIEGGAAISYHDPYVNRLPKSRHFKLPNLTSEKLTAEFLASRDAVVIVTDHSNVDYDFVMQHAPAVIDTRNATRGISHGREKRFAA
jgi:UDP-N-acetyl-D-glucosamine dehydrogenase